MKTVTFNEALLTQALDTMFGEQARVAVVRFYDMLEGVRTDGYVQGLADGWEDANVLASLKHNSPKSRRRAGSSLITETRSWSPTRATAATRRPTGHTTSTTTD
jgi:hypothetical protein